MVLPVRPYRLLYKQLVWYGLTSIPYHTRPFRSLPPREDENEGIPGITIDYTRVRIWPILGLLERIGKALGEDIVGSVDDAKLKTWEDDDEPQNASKRGREAPDVFNGNLGEKSDTNGKPIAIKKPRLDNSPVSRCGTV